MNNSCSACMDFNDVDTDDFTKIQFDTYNDRWDDIEISLASDGLRCYIHKKDDKRTIVSGFKLSNNPRTNIFCAWNFFQSKNSGKFIARPTFYKMNANNQASTTTKEKVRIAFEKGEFAVKFWEMINFIQGFNDLVDLGEFGDKYGVVDKKRLLLALNSCSPQEQLGIINESIKDRNISYQQLERLLDNSKGRSLAKFKELLASEDTKESDFQIFFEENIWIFAAISLKLFFLGEVIPQADVGTPNTQGRRSPKMTFYL